MKKGLNVRSVETLLVEAVEKAGSQAELARRIGVKPPEVTEWKKGKRPISPETIGLLCDVLELPGTEAQRLAALAIVGAEKNAGKRATLRRAFFGLWVLGASVVTLLTGPVSEAQASDQNIHCRAWDALRRAVRFLLLRARKRPESRSDGTARMGGGFTRWALGSVQPLAV